MAQDFNKQDVQGVSSVTHGRQLGDRIGHIVMYDLPAGMDELVTNVKVSIEANGFDFSEFPLNTPSEAFTRAVNAVRNANKKDHSIFVRKVSAASDFKKFQMTVENRVGDEDEEDAELEYSAELGITLRDPNEKKGGARLEFSSEDHPEIQDTIRGVFNHSRRYVDRYQFSWWAQNTVHKMAAISMRQRGGTWFIAEKFSQTLERLQTVFEDLGGVMYMFPLFETAGAEVLHATESVVIEDLKRLQDEVREMAKDQARKGKPVTERMLATRRKYLKEKRHRIEVIQDLLGITSQKVEAATIEVAKAIKAAERGEAKSETPEASEAPVEVTPVAPVAPEPVAPVVNVFDTSLAVTASDNDPF